MANRSLRRFGAMLAGIVAAVLVVGVVEALGHMIFPPPPGLDLSKPEDLARLMEVIPLGAKLAVVFAWFLGALVGGWTALRLGAFPVQVWLVAAVMAALGLITTQMFPHPWWMVAAALVLPALAVWLVLRKR
jgi:hypothetical protein